MEETGIRFPAGYLLDPRAEEFRPGNHSPENQFTLVTPQIYYPYHPSIFPPPSGSSTGSVQMMSFYDGGLGYQQQPTSATAYVSSTAAQISSNSPWPPISTTATRVLLLTSVPREVTEVMVRRDMEIFGEVRAVQMERLHQDGIVTVHFYDLRHAQVAMKEIQEQHMQQQLRSRLHYMNYCYSVQVVAPPPPPPPPGPGLIAGRVVWAQFTIPGSLPGHGGRNQGTIVIFNLDSGVSEVKLREIFEAFGEVKELRKTPSKRNQRFVEYYDIRDASKALSEMNGREINGKCILIEFSRPGGQNKIKIKFCDQQKQQQEEEKIMIDSVSSLSLVGCDDQGNNNFSNASVSKKNTGKKKKKKKNNGEKLTERKQLMRSRSWKSGSSSSGSSSRQKGLGSNFLIDEAAIMESNCIRDTRTTVMIKNIPNKYSQKLLLNMLDNHCIHCNEQINDGDDQPLSSYDFLYLPIDFNNKCNVGYGFVNLTSPQAAWRLYKAFHLQPWEVFNSRKICEVTYARLQGLEALKEHFKNSKFACETEEYLPVVFSPPRDGKCQLTEPLVMGGQAADGELRIKKCQRKVVDDDGDGNSNGGGGDGSSSGGGGDGNDEGGSGSSLVEVEGMFGGRSERRSSMGMTSVASKLQAQVHHPMGACR